MVTTRIGTRCFPAGWCAPNENARRSRSHKGWLGRAIRPEAGLCRRGRYLGTCALCPRLLGPHLQQRVPVDFAGAVLQHAFRIERVVFGARLTFFQPHATPLVVLAQGVLDLTHF